MTDKRMFSLSVCDTDWFLDLPLSTQAVYFHLNLRADDDGFVANHKSILRKVGANANDYQLLVAKRFILEFESGVIVIKHWRMHNTIRPDRKQDTQFKEEFSQLTIKDNKSYTEKRIEMSGNCPSTARQVSGTRPRNDRIDLDIGLDIDIVNIDTNVSCSNDTDKSNHFELKVDHFEQRFDSFWNAYPKKVGKQKCIDWFKKHKPSQELTNKMLATIELWKKSEQWSKEKGQYIPQPYTWLNRGGWDDEAPTITPMTGNSKHNINDDWGTL